MLFLSLALDMALFELLHPQYNTIQSQPVCVERCLNMLRLPARTSH